MTENARRATSPQHTAHLHAAITEPTAPIPGLDQGFGAVFITALSICEHLTHSDPVIRRWPLGGWVLLDSGNTAVGFHGYRRYCTLDANWGSHTTAFTPFIPRLRNQCTNHPGSGPRLVEGQPNVRRLTA